MKLKDYVDIVGHGQYTVREDGEDYEYMELERAYERFDGAEHATLTAHCCINGVCDEQVIDEK